MAGLDLNVDQQRWQFLVLALAIMLTLCVNMWMLQRRFRPLERLIDRIEQADPSSPVALDLTARGSRPRRSAAWPSRSGACSTAWSRSAAARDSS